jgi:APA family basic amino acid/polyamine antiporter
MPSSSRGESSASGLVRGIGRWDLVAVAINGIIGAGIFGLPGRVYGLIGAYSLLSFLICAFVVTLIILCFAEVGSRFSETGGPYLYARESFGKVAGFEVGWLLWVVRLTAFAANVNLLVEYLSYFWPAASSGWHRTGIISTIVVSYAAINIVGVRNAALFSDVFSIGKLIPIIVFITVGLFYLDPGRFSLGPLPEVGAFSNSVLLLVYAFSGFEIAMIPAGEIRDPRRNLPFALLTSVVVVALTYILIQVVCIGTLPALAGSTRPLVDASQQFLGRIGTSLITAGVIVSIAGNLSVVLLAGSRLPFAMASQGELPRWLAATHPRFHTPHTAILLTSALVLILSISGSFIYAVTISTIARLAVYVTTCAALPLLRRREQEMPAHFRVPGGNVVAGLALLLSIWLLAHSTWREARDATLAALLGLVVYYLYRRFRPAAIQMKEM